MCIALAYIYRIQVKDRLYAYFFFSSDFPVAADNLFVFYVPRYKHYKLI